MTYARSEVRTLEVRLSHVPEQWVFTEDPKREWITFDCTGLLKKTPGSDTWEQFALQWAAPDRPLPLLRGYAHKEPIIAPLQQALQDALGVEVMPFNVRIIQGGH